MLEPKVTKSAAKSNTQQTAARASQTLNRPAAPVEADRVRRPQDLAVGKPGPRRPAADFSAVPVAAAGSQARLTQTPRPEPPRVPAESHPARVLPARVATVRMPVVPPQAHGMPPRLAGPAARPAGPVAMAVGAAAKSRGRGGPPTGAPAVEPSQAKSPGGRIILSALAESVARARAQATDRLEAATRSLEQHAQQTRSVLLTAHERHAQAIHGSFAAAHDRVAATAQDAALRIGTERASHAATLAAAHAGSLTQGHAAFAAGQDRARGLGTTYASRAQQVADEVAAALQTTVHGHGAEARQIGETKAQRRFSEDSAEATAKVAHEIAADTAEKIEAGVDDGATQLQATGPQAAESFGQHAEEIATQVGAGEADLQAQVGGMFNQANSGLSELSAAGVEQMHHAVGPLHASLAKAQTELHAELQADVTRKLEQSDAAVANAANTLHVELHKALDAGAGEVGKLSRQVADAQVPERDAGDFAGRIRTHLAGSFGTIAEQAPRASQQIGSELDRATATTMSATAAAAADIGRQTQGLAGQATAQLGQQHAAIAGQLGSVATQATGNATATIAQVGTGLTGKLGEIDQAFGKSLGDYRSSLSKQVTDADTKAKEPLSSLPSRIDQAQQRAEERSHKGFWERQWDDFKEMVTDPGFWAGLIVGLVLAVAVIALVVAGVLTGGLAIILAMAVVGAIAAAVGSIVGQATNHSFTGGWDWSRVDWKQVGVSALIGAAVAAALTGLVLYMGPAMAVTLKGIAIISLATGVVTVITTLVTGQPWDKNLLANMALAGVLAWLSKYVPIPGRGRTAPPPEERPPPRMTEPAPRPEPQPRTPEPEPQPRTPEPERSSYNPRTRTDVELNLDTDPTPRPAETAEQAQQRAQEAQAELARRGQMAFCFIAGTSVRTPDGARQIEHLLPGEYVLAKCEQGNVGSYRVLERMRGFTKDLFHLDLPGGGRLTTTRNHPFFVVGKGWVGAAKIAAGDALLSIEGVPVIVLAARHQRLEDAVSTFNIHVEIVSTYYVGDGPAVWVHNADPNAPIFGTRLLWGLGAGGPRQRTPTATDPGDIVGASAWVTESGQEAGRFMGVRSASAKGNHGAINDAQLAEKGLVAVESTGTGPLADAGLGHVSIRPAANPNPKVPLSPEEMAEVQTKLAEIKPVTQAKPKDFGC
jgi:hypothetical protein